MSSILQIELGVGNIVDLKFFHPIEQKIRENVNLPLSKSIEKVIDFNGILNVTKMKVCDVTSKTAVMLLKRTIGPNMF